MDHAPRADDGLAVVESAELMDLYLAALQGGVGLRTLSFGKRIDPEERRAALQFRAVALLGQALVTVKRRNRCRAQFGGSRVGGRRGLRGKSRCCKEGRQKEPCGEEPVRESLQLAPESFIHSPGPCASP